MRLVVIDLVCGLLEIARREFCEQVEHSACSHQTYNVYSRMRFFNFRIPPIYVGWHSILAGFVVTIRGVWGAREVRRPTFRPC